MRASQLSPLSGLWSRSARSGDPAGSEIRAEKARLRCLSDARVGDRVRLVEAPGKEVRTWLLLSGWEEAAEVQVLHSGWGWCCGLHGGAPRRRAEVGRAGGPRDSYP